MKKERDRIWKHSDITQKIISAAIDVHNTLGAGYQESIYHNAIIIALLEKGLKCESEKEFRVIFKNKTVGIYKLDLVVEDKVIIELKAVVGEMPEIFKAQVISYLKCSQLEVSLLINFGNKNLDIKRLARYKDY